MSKSFDVNTVSVQMTVSPTTITTVLDPKSYDKGYDAGHTSGEQKGYTEGHEAGRQQGDYEGYTRGLNEGETTGYENGFREGEQKGYTQGHEAGYTSGVQTGYTEGHEAGYADGDLAFFNMFTMNNTRTNYRYGFRFADFSNYAFPKTVKPVDVVGIFSEYKGTKLPKNIDFSSVVVSNNVYRECFHSATELQEVDFSSAPAPNSYSYTFYYCTSLKSLIINSKETTDFSYWLTQCSALEDITINGTIGKNIGFADCSSLNNKSIRNIINALSATTSGRTITLKKTAVQKAFETSSGANDGNTSEEWLTLVASKSNWTITLA